MSTKLDKISITTTFIFEAGKPWRHIDEYKKDLNDFLLNGKYVGEVVENAGDLSNNFIVILTPKETNPPPTIPKVKFPTK